MERSMKMGEKRYESLNVPNKFKLEVFYSLTTSESYKGCILCVPGICHGAWCFENFLKFFPDNGFDCFALSFRGHAGSLGYENLNKFGLSDYSEDIKECINYCLNEKKVMRSIPFLLGHSMGGAVVQNFIGKYANNIKGAILFAPATAGGMGIWEQIKPIFSDGIMNGFKILDLINKNKQVSTDVMKNSAFFSNRVSDKKIEYYNKLLHNESKTAISELGKPYAKEPYNKEDIPVMVIGSYADAYFGEGSLTKTANAYNCFKNNTRKRLEILPDLCHDMMLDPEWEESARVVKEFMESNK